MGCSQQLSIPISDVTGRWKDSLSLKSGQKSIAMHYNQCDWEKEKKTGEGKSLCRHKGKELLKLYNTTHSDPETTLKRSSIVLYVKPAAPLLWQLFPGKWQGWGGILMRRAQKLPALLLEILFLLSFFLTEVAKAPGSRTGVHQCAFVLVQPGLSCGSLALQQYR